MTFFADNKADSKCSKQLADWNKVNFQMGGVTLSAQVNVSGSTPAGEQQLQELGIDTKALQKEGCSLQVALLPFGDKDEPILYKGMPYLLG